MLRFKPAWRFFRGNLTLFCGAAMAACFAAIISLPVLRGPSLITFLACFFTAAGAYTIAVARLDRDQPSLRVIWAAAVLFRLTMLFASPPTLSDDVYRYLWDGRLANAGVNPYAHAVESPLLDRFDSPHASG